MNTHRPPISVAERGQPLHEWNDTTRSLPNELCVHQHFEAQATRSPDATAVEVGDQSCSYRELNGWSNQFAARLRRAGVEHSVVVGLCLERSIELLIGILGTLKAGGTFLPLDPGYPTTRLAYMLNDSAASFIVTQEHLRNLLPESDREVVILGAGDRVVNTYTDRPTNRAGGSDLAYILYTSGSTGLPKGVQIEHRSLVNLLQSLQIKPGISSDDTMFSTTTFSFDMAMVELFLPLVCGARLVLAGQDALLDGAALNAGLSKCQATIAQATPSTWRLLIDAGWQGSENFQVFCGGEAFTRDLAEQLLERASAVWNMYGPTETTVYAAIHRVEKPEEIVPIGRPIDNTQLHILDAAMEPVGVGESGELYIGGIGLARGYVNLPEMTAQRFVDTPFRDGASQRLYRTGDRARFLPNGDIQYLDRIDRQVKLRGYRIELGEIESVLEQHPSVAHAAAIVREDTPADRMLVAYVVLGAGQVATNDELRHHLRQALPEYMQPAKLQQLPEMPLYPSGKIDRAALPRPSRERQSQQVPYQAAANALQQTLTYIWKDVLDVERIGIHDNFFDAGGHSLSVTMVVARVRDELGVELPLRTMFESPTIELIEKSIKRLQGQAVHEDKPILDELRLAFPTERVPRMAEFLRREIARILNIDPDHITTDQAPATLRLGVGVVDLMRVLKDALKVQFYPPEFLAQSSILSLAEYLLDEIERSANLPEMATEEPLTSFDVKLRFPLYAPHHHVPGIPPPAQKPFSKPVSSGATGKNPPAAFIHATSRSGSTLLRVMLAGHKKLFCPPELNLLFFDNMKQWAEDFGYSDDYQWPALGLHAAFAELKNLGPNEGWQVLDELVAQNRPVGEVYGEVQSLAGGRLLIDKTATYSFDLKVLERGEQLFEEPRYIYLLRHPYSFIESCLRVRLDRLFHRRNQGEPDPDPYAIAEKIWSISHSNLATFFDKVGPARVHVVHYEQLIHDPEPVMRGICEFLGVPFDESVLTPYDGCKARWIATFGDPNILQRSGLDKRLAESWQSLELPRTFSPATRELAKRLGYEVT